MTCERYRDALIDVGAGAAAPAGVEAHLGSCAACRAELQALRQALAVADAELARLPMAEPSPDLAARIRATVADTAQARPGWRPGWGLPLAAAAAAVIVASAFVAQREPRPHSPGAVAERRAAAATPRATPAPEGIVAATAPSSRPVASERPTRRAVPREPEVLVPAGEAEALVRLAASLRQRSVAPDSLLVADLSAPLSEPKLAEIRPIEIVPLDPTGGFGVE